jgi:hypothetical protein
VAKTQNVYSGVFFPKLKLLLQGLLPIFGSPKLKIWGPKLKILLRGLLPQTQNFYSRGFCSFLGALNSKFLLQGLLPIFGGTQIQNLGAKTQNFYSRVFCPKLFLHLKSFLAGLHFQDNKIKKAVTTCFASQAASFYNEGIQKLVQHYDKCLNSGGNYVEK